MKHPIKANTIRNILTTLRTLLNSLAKRDVIEKAAGVNVCLYVAMRHSRVSQRRLKLERSITDELRRELPHSSNRVTMKHYVRDERDRLGTEGPNRV